MMPYQDLVAALTRVGLTAQFQNEDQLIVSNQVGPVWPNRGNSFWLSQRKGEWYLSTWSPIGYRIPPKQDIVALCVACMVSAAKAMQRVPADIVARFELKKLSFDEYTGVFPGHPE